MANIIKPGDEERTILSRVSQPADRRTFLKWTGVGAAAFVAACDQEETRTITEPQPPVQLPPPPPETFEAVTLDFSSDTGVLNYAFALEQLEAAFYTMAVAHPNFAATFNAEEQRMVINLRDVEVIHREFYRAALGENAIADLTPNFSTINFGSRLSVLDTAHTFETLGTHAYNGAGRLLEDPTLLTVAGKIVSVEARHASMLADRLNRRSGEFAPRAFDLALSPAEVLPVVQPFVRNQITATGL